jgi:hypothetical protein
MDCDWIFVSQDRSREEVTLAEPNLPQLGDGKIRAGKGFEVMLVVTNRVAQPNPTVVAFEFPQNP